MTHLVTTGTYPTGATVRCAPPRWPDGTPPPPSGCRWCGTEQRHHGQRWRASAGWHTWARPTDAQILASMRARRATRASKLIDTRPLVYEVPGQPPISRACRTWSLPDGTTVSIVTEHPDDTGMSITNAAAEVRTALEKRWGIGCRIVEHYPWPSGEHWDEQYRLYPNVIRWYRLTADEVRAIREADQ